MNTFKKAHVALTSITLLSGLAACGNAEPTAAPTTVVTVTASAEPTPSETLPDEAGMTEESIAEDEALYAILHNESTILNHLGVDGEEYYTYMPDGTLCSVDRYSVYTSMEDVEMYGSQGLITAPLGTAAIGNDSLEAATCQKYFTEKMATFPEEESGAGTYNPPTAGPVRQVNNEWFDDEAGDYDYDTMDALRADIGTHLGLAEGGLVTTPAGVQCDAGYGVLSGSEIEEAKAEGLLVAVNSQGTGVTLEGENQQECQQYFAETLSTFTK